MKRIILSVMLLLSIACGLRAETAPVAAELTKLLHDFLAGAGRNDIAMHERFWADDLIYTSALGRRKGKADIMRELREEGPSKPGDETAVYTAEEIRIQQYGDTAIVAFRLVATTDKAGKKEVRNYLNTGTFLKRNGKWQAAGWQATAVPKEPAPTPTPGAEPKKN
jgi:ketosteroid isomerase-like protein